MATLKILPASEEEVPVILAMIRELAEYERLSHVVVATEERLRKTLFGDRPAAEVLLAAWQEQGDLEWAGMALFFPNYSTFLAQPGIYLEDLYVKPHLRGKGIGFGLLRHLAKIAIERGCGRLEWEVLDWNQPSIHFYKRLGAVPMDEWTRFRLTGDAIARLADDNVGHRA